MARIFLFLAFGLLLCLNLPAHAAEIIHRYNSRVIVGQDGVLRVTEIIEVTAENQEIRRGIYRDFPLFRRTFLGGVLPSEFNIQSVTKNGESEPYHTEISEDSVRLYIGDSHLTLPSGRRYIYEITYTTPRQVFFYDEYDELNWNVIGTGWSFAIEDARAEITLPRNAPVIRYSAYTGKALSKESHYTAKQEPGRLVVEANRTLAPHEGMTVAVAFPKGYVAQPADMIGAPFFWRQHPGLPVMLTGLLVMLAYYGWAWRHVGRDPRGRGRAPFYSPPKGISPAMAAHILATGSSNSEKTLTAAILSLAAKGYLHIEEKGRFHYELVPTGRKDEAGQILSSDENLIFNRINAPLNIRPGNTALADIASDHRKAVDEACHKTYFLRNSQWWFAGILPVLASLLIISFNPVIPAGYLWMGIMFVAAFGGGSLWGLCRGIRQIATGSWGCKAAGVFLVIWATIFSMGSLMGLAVMGAMMSWLVIAVIVAMLALFILMRPIMKAPTREGRAVMDHIAGLKYYMESVEEKILKKFDPPQMSRELYEKYLPYAVALGVESKWGEKFAIATAGAATAAAAAASYAVPTWYSGSGSFSLGSFSAFDMISSFSSAVSAASTVASSGSSGGGSVGGGGGGGGGGGW